MSDEPRSSPLRRPMIIVLAILAAAVAAGGSFFGGIAFQRSRQTNAQQQFFADRGFAPGGLAPSSGAPAGGLGAFGDPSGMTGSGGPGRGASGTVESLEGDTLTLSGAEGEVTVRLTDETVITLTARGAREDLQPDAQVTVIGERDDAGVITAIAVQIQPSAP